MNKTYVLKQSGAIIISVAVLVILLGTMSVSAATKPTSSARKTQGWHMLKEQNNGQHLGEIAKQLGITVEELKQAQSDPEARERIRVQMEAFRDSRLQQRAEKLGITVEELKARIESRHADHLGQMAERLNISVEDLQIALDDPYKREEIHNQLQQFNEQERATHAQELAEYLGISVDELKALHENNDLRNEYSQEISTWHDQKIQERADDLGIDVDELKDKMKLNHKNSPWNKRGQRKAGMMFGESPDFEQR